MDISNVHNELAAQARPSLIRGAATTDPPPTSDTTRPAHFRPRRREQVTVSAHGPETHRQQYEDHQADIRRLNEEDQVRRRQIQHDPEAATSFGYPLARDPGRDGREAAHQGSGASSIVAAPPAETEDTLQASSGLFNLSASTLGVDPRFLSPRVQSRIAQALESNPGDREDRGNGTMTQSSTVAGDDTQDAPSEESSRRRKRRKIDHEKPASSLVRNGYRYGHQGAVIPGRLKMEIASCDGGVIGARTMHGQPYFPENVLRNDQSVYCTRRGQCNLILRHVGETNFTLTKVVIRSPATGFTAPIREGLIFVSMSSNGLLHGSSHYRMKYPGCKTHLSGINSWDENQRPLSRRRDSTARQVPPPISDLQARISSNLAPTGRSHETAAQSAGSTTIIPSIRPVEPISPWSMNVSMDCDSISDSDEPTSPRTEEDRYRRSIEPPLYDDDTSEDSDIDGQPDLRRWTSPGHLSREHRCLRGRRRAEPNLIESDVLHGTAGGTASTTDGVADGSDATHHNATGTETRSPRSSALTPNARFFIDKEKDIVSINFEPPAAGKYILFKLWSPASDTNIDIQSVMAYGFAGPRYFPSQRLL